MHSKSPALYFLLKPFYNLFQFRKSHEQSTNHLRLSFFQNHSESKALMIYNEHRRTITGITIEVTEAGNRYIAHVASLKYTESVMVAFEDLLDPKGFPFQGYLSSVTVNSSRGRRKFTVKGNRIYRA